MADNSTKRIHIVGRKNNGKTQLVVDLVTELSRSGYRVATIKHTHHRHELDTPGKDSWRHRQAGAAMVGVLSDQLSAIFLPVDTSVGGEDRYRLLQPLLDNCDLVLVEGNLATAAPKIEVWRAVISSEPIYPGVPGIEMVVSDDALPRPHPMHMPRTDVAAIAAWIMARLGLTKPTGERPLDP